MKFAFVTDELPVTGVAGHLAFNAAILGWLRDQGHEVVVLLVRPRFDLPVRRYGDGPVLGRGVVGWGNWLFSFRPSDFIPILGRYAAAKLPTFAANIVRRRGRAGKYGLVDAILGSFVSPEQADWCAAHIAALQPDAVIIDTIFRATMLSDPRLASVNSVLLAHDVFHLRHRALASAGYQVYPALLTRDVEAALLQSARHIVAIQTDEAAEIRAMCPDRDVQIAPMPAICKPRPASSLRDPNRLVFIGSDSLPNLDGLRWFFQDIWPRLRHWRPELMLHLVGNCGPALGRLPPGVTARGKLKNLSPSLHRASLAISPLRVGSGLKIKLLDYARHGLTTVATPVSLQGFARDARAPFIAASDAVSFAAAIADCLKQPEPQSREQDALAYVETYYGITQNFAGLAEALGLPVKISAS